MLSKYYISLTLTLLFLISPSLSILPAPKHVLLDSQLVLTSSNQCPSFELHPTSDQVLEIVPKSQVKNDGQETGLQYYFNKIIKRLKLQSQCSQNHEQQNPQVHKIHLKINKQIQEQGYKIISTKTHVQLQFSTYVGYVYALETFSQIVKNNVIQIGIIEDEPVVSYRGIMIDPVRHFIGLNYIKNLILAMPIFKLNVLHWSFSNDEAFVFGSLSHPQLTQAGRYSPSEFYSVAQIQQLIQLATKNAITIIPQFDTPAHVRSWGLADQWKQKNITILCDGGQHYNHQFDVSKDQVYKLTTDVLKEVDVLFRDSPYLHLGGDQVFDSCWKKRPAIDTFMKLHNIPDYIHLQVYWRSQLKQALPNNRKLIFWRTTNDTIQTSPQDIVQFWGNQNQTFNFSKLSPSKLILSPSDYLYLNSGKTNIWSNRSFGHYSTWKQIYQQFQVFPAGINQSRIVGAQVCLWGEVQNQDTLQNQIWMRASAFADKVWNNTVRPLATLVSDLVYHQKILIGMGIQPSPITNQFCQIYPTICFSTKSEEDSKKDQDIIVIQ